MRKTFDFAEFAKNRKSLSFDSLFIIKILFKQLSFENEHTFPTFNLSLSHVHFFSVIHSFYAVTITCVNVVFKLNTFIHLKLLQYFIFLYRLHFLCTSLMHNLITLLNLASFAAHTLMMKSRKNSRIEINIMKTLIFDIHICIFILNYTL